MPLTVSVVIPTYNRPQATARAVRSVLAQTYPVCEIILVDDGSIPAFDPGVYGWNDTRIRVVRLHHNLGASAARQAGVDAAVGKVIAFLDSDDVWLPDKLAVQLPFLKEKCGDLVAVSCGWETAPEDGGRPTRRIPIPSADVRDFASGCWYSPGATVVLPKRVFDVVGPFDPSLRRLEDLDWFLRLALAGGRLIVAPTVGAIIATGRRSRSGPVEDACARIQARFACCDTQFLSPAATRRLHAYLDLERAAAARNEGQLLAMAWHLGRSFALAPRTSIPLKRWWYG